MKLDFGTDDNLVRLLNESKAKPLGQSAAESLISRLCGEELLTKREAVLLKNLMNGSIYGLPSEETDYIRGRIIRMMLITLLRDDLQ